MACLEVTLEFSAREASSLRFLRSTRALLERRQTAYAVKNDLSHRFCLGKADGKYISIVQSVECTGSGLIDGFGVRVLFFGPDRSRVIERVISFYGALACDDTSIEGAIVETETEKGTKTEKKALLLRLVDCRAIRECPALIEDST
jgi:hypothetical protein